MNTRNFSLIMGIVFLIVGVLGFVPGITLMDHSAAHGLMVESGYGLLFGLFPVNVLHNLVHLVFGFWGLTASRNLAQAKVFTKGTAVIYAAFTIFGFIPVLRSTFGLVPLWGHDIWLHGIIALASGYFGFVHSDAPIDRRYGHTNMERPV